MAGGAGAAGGSAGGAGGGSKLLSRASRKGLTARLKRVAASPASTDRGGVNLEVLSERLKNTRFRAPPALAVAGGGGVRRKLQSCPEGSGVTVTSSEFPQLDGCLVETELDDTNGEVEYVTESGQGVIYSVTPTGYAEVWRHIHCTAYTDRHVCLGVSPAMLLEV